ncbi:hypothetical protein CC2G_013663 [Coprinopsis cinerea AmutBmut pab1-1]|nr:hypothetical protein CC2G_013663 [Coprinopsis cinerea AmutBmut pab1-1]
MFASIVRRNAKMSGGSGLNGNPYKADGNPVLWGAAAATFLVGVWWFVGSSNKQSSGKQPAVPAGVQTNVDQGQVKTETLRTKGNQDSPSSLK